MSDLRNHRLWPAVAYGLVVLLIAFELAVAWFMLHPDVPADYRAYYIDQTTTCMNQPVSGQYAFGTVVDFRSPGREQAKPLRVCGWEGPAGDGTHAVGTRSRLRFAIPPETTDVALTLELVAVDREGHPSQRVRISANGTELQTLTAAAGIPLSAVITIPAHVTALAPGKLDIALDFPDAIRMAPGDSDARLRSIKLLSAGVAAVP